MVKYRNNFYSSYKKHTSLKSEDCFYCGHFGGVKDHVPPISRLYMFENYPRLLIRACRQCNSYLGARLYPTVITRLEALFVYYRKKYARLLSNAEWSYDELEELQGTLKEYVKNENIKHESAHNRLEFITSRKNQLLVNPQSLFDFYD